MDGDAYRFDFARHRVGAELEPEHLEDFQRLVKDFTRSHAPAWECLQRRSCAAHRWSGAVRVPTLERGNQGVGEPEGLGGEDG